MFGFDRFFSSSGSKKDVLNDLHLHDELHDGEFDASASKGGGWRCIGSWLVGDPNAGATAVGLMCIARNSKEFLILVRNSNPTMPQLWVR